MKLRILSGFIIFLMGLSFVNFGFSEEPIGKVMDTILPFEKLELAGFLKNEASVGIEDGQLMKLKNIFDLKAEYKFSEWLNFFVNFNTWYDSAYDIEGQYRVVTDNEKNTKLTMPIKQEWLRECFFDIYTPRLDIRLGKQQVVWGTTDGVRILDMINPLDYREWTIKDYTDIRIPLWMLKLEGEVMLNGHLQVLLIPDYEPNYYAPAQAPFALRATTLGARRPPSMTIDDEPERTFENTKVGVRWRNVIETGLFNGLEYTLNYLHTYDFASSAYTVVTPGPFITLTRRAEQIEVFGGSFSKSITEAPEGLIGNFIRGWTLRGEFAYVKGGAMNYGVDGFSPKGTVDVDQYNSALGFDKTFFTKWDFSVQYIQLIADAKSDYLGLKLFTAPPIGVGPNTLFFGPTRGPLDKTERLISLRIATDFINERLKPEILVLYGDDNDWRISPKINFEVNDNWSIATGFNIFEGKETQLNGQFDDNDQFFFETKYSW